MTRETKIGLLVGLAFIIVIGVLLSDHFSNSMRPPQAPLVNTADNVLRGNAAPGGARQVAMVQPDNDTAPRGQIPTVRDMQQPGPRREGTAIVDVGGPRRTDGGSITITDTTGREPIRTVAPIPGPGTVSPRDTHVEMHAGDPIVRTPIEDTHTIANTAQYKEYTAESGDTVSKIAAKMLGGKSKEKLDSIINANPSLKANPNKVTVGEKYRIPVATPARTTDTPAPDRTDRLPIPDRTTSPDRTPTPDRSTDRTPDRTADRTTPPDRTAPDDSADRRDTARPALAGTYEVKSGDTLWKVASRELGSKNLATVNQIKDLNKDILKGSDALSIGMKLKLPPKAVASAD